MLPIVFELNLAGNNINNVTVKAFDGLLQLLVLNLTNNNLTRIPNGAFQGIITNYINLNFRLKNYWVDLRRSKESSAFVSASRHKEAEVYYYFRFLQPSRINSTMFLVH